MSTLEALTLDQRLATAVLGTFAYLRQAFWPANLAFFYPHPALVTPEEFAPLGARVLLGALLLAALTLGAWRLRRRAPALLAGWAWMLVMFLPVIGIVQVGRQFYADRYAYLPLLGLVLALVFGARELLPRGAQRAAFAAGLAAALGFALVAWRQVGTWKDDPALCARALAVTERNDVAHQLLGDYYQRQGDLPHQRPCARRRCATQPARARPATTSSHLPGWRGGVMEKRGSMPGAGAVATRSGAPSANGWPASAPATVSR